MELVMLEGSNRRDLARPGVRAATLTLALLAACLSAVARGQVITEFTIPTASSGPAPIVAGPDGNLWFTEVSGNQIGRITTAGVFTEFPVPTAASQPISIAAGPDGNLWFTEGAGNKVGRITTAGVIKEFPVSTAGSVLRGIVSGPDGSLWFAEAGANQIGRITTAGVIAEFPIPTAGSTPENIVAGPDGNLWFTEFALGASQIGRITTAGVVTEFPTPTAASGPIGIVSGPDGKLWFTERFVNQIGRITTAGVITEFPIPTAGSGPAGIASGPDVLWFTELVGNQIGRITPAGVVTEFPVPTASSNPEGIVSLPHGDLWFTESSGNKIGRITRAPLTPQPMDVDANAVAGTSSNANGVLEPGETVQIAPTWLNTLTTAQGFDGMASDLTGPAGPTYSIGDTSAGYGSVAGGATSNCNGASGDCYLMTVSGTRAAQHWDATFTESLSIVPFGPETAGLPVKTWTLHVGDSFPDVPTSNSFYPFVENLFHNGVTGGCGGGDYCPGNSVTRAQMAVFLMKSKAGAAEIPPPPTGTVFADVPANSPFAPFIEQLAHFGITGGCGGGDYCPNNPVTRAQMAAFLMKAEHGSSYVPPACTGFFPDVTCPSQFADWIEQLHTEGITAGCGGGNYCPNSPNTRGQMAVFLVKTFGLLLYGP
jgi:virginiamycin B lyase